MNRINYGALVPLWIALFFFVLIASAWNVAEARKVNILATTTDLASIARAIAGEHATVKSLCTGKEDPHFLQAKPSYIVKARNADLWIRVGMELEIGWELPILDGARNTIISVGAKGHLDASERVRRLEVPTTRISRSMGDVHPQGNPHYWLDPLNGRIVAKSIAARLEQLFPQYANDFRKNLKAFQKALDESMFGKALVERMGGAKLWTLELKNELESSLKFLQMERQLSGWKGRMKPFQGENIMTYHRSWSYFADRFSLKVADELEPKPGIPPSPGHVLEVIRKVKEQKVSVLLMEPFYSHKSPNLVASKTGIQVVVCANSVGGGSAAKDYFSMIGNIVDKLATAFEAAKKTEEN
ncbi:MAG: metal ABC transporter substrate-binding protein [Thermodesulfobacteriota bacterium]|nr:metal ABC transporter substrate-binding protein [Thermodesulfobacteriota bacterium]